MQLPQALTDESNRGFCYEKKVILNSDVFFSPNLHPQVEIFHRLITFMHESNLINNHNFPFYQLRVRPTHFYETPNGICFELRFGNSSLLNNQ